MRMVMTGRNLRFCTKFHPFKFLSFFETVNIQVDRDFNVRIDIIVL
jgi:hypothetical protein